MCVQIIHGTAGVKLAGKRHATRVSEAWLIHGQRLNLGDKVGTVVRLNRTA